MSGKKRKQDTGTVLRRRLGLLVFALAALIFSFLSAPLAESAEDPPIEPLASEWQQVMITKHRAIISFMDTDYGLKTFRGQAENLETDLSNYYGANVITTTRRTLEFSGQATAGFSPSPRPSDSCLRRGPSLMTLWGQRPSPRYRRV